MQKAYGDYGHTWGRFLYTTCWTSNIYGHEYFVRVYAKWKIVSIYQLKKLSDFLESLQPNPYEFRDYVRGLLFKRKHKISNQRWRELNERHPIFLRSLIDFRKKYLIDFNKK